LMALVVLLLAVALAGCTAQLIQTAQINEDGSGKLVQNVTYTMDIGCPDNDPNKCDFTGETPAQKFHDALLVAAAGNASSSLINFGTKVVIPEGGTFQQANSPDWKTQSYTYARPFTSTDQLNRFLGEVPQIQVDAQFDESIFQQSLHVDRQVQKTPDGGSTTTIHMTGSIAFQDPKGELGTCDSSCQFSTDVTLPGKVTSIGGTMGQNNDVTYAAHINQQAKVDVTGVVTHAPPPTPTATPKPSGPSLPCGMVLVPTVGLLYVFVVLMRRARRG
jgi:hypothetical protein